jgi:hypothetical protein
MKKLFIAAIAVMSFGLANAQEVSYGVKAGLNVANLAPSKGDAGDARIGFNVGGFVEIGISEKFSVQPELLFSTQGNKYSETILGTKIEFTQALNYINIPVLAKYYVAEGFAIELGPQIGILASANTNVSAGGESASDSIKDNFKTIDFALAAGFSYKFTENFFANARYNLGLSNVAKDSGDFTLKNNVIQVGVGYKF